MKLNFDKMGGVVMAVVQDDQTKDVLMVGVMNQEAVEKTVQTQRVTFYSRSKGSLWMKGEESGNVLQVISIRKDCDEDTLLILAKPIGPTCHTGERTCFDRDGAREPNPYYRDYLRDIYLNPDDQKKLRIVLPDGNSQNTMNELFTKIGYPITVEKPRTKRGKTSASWIDYVDFQRPKEIPSLVAAGYFDLGILGTDCLIESGVKDVEVLNGIFMRDLKSYNPIKLVLAVEKCSSIESLRDLPKGATIATEYPRIARGWLDQRNRQDIILMPSLGNTEHKVRFGAFAVIDIVETGHSLFENDMIAIEEVLKTEVKIIANKASFDISSPQRPNITAFLRHF